MMAYSNAYLGSGEVFERFWSMLASLKLTMVDRVDGTQSSTSLELQAE